MSTGNKVGWAEDAWQRRTTPTYINIILQKEIEICQMRYIYNCKYSNRLSITYLFWRIRYRKCVEKIRNVFHLLEQSLHSMKSFSIRDLIL